MQVTLFAYWPVVAFASPVSCFGFVDADAMVHHVVLVYLVLGVLLSSSVEVPGIFLHQQKNAILPLQFCLLIASQGEPYHYS